MVQVSPFFTSKITLDGNLVEHRSWDFPNRYSGQAWKTRQEHEKYKVTFVMGMVKLSHSGVGKSARYDRAMIKLKVTHRATYACRLLTGVESAWKGI